MKIFPEDMTVEQYQEAIVQLMQNRQQELQQTAQWQRRAESKIKKALEIAKMLPEDDPYRASIIAALT